MRGAGEGDRFRRGREPAGEEDSLGVGGPEARMRSVEIGERAKGVLGEGGIRVRFCWGHAPTMLDLPRRSEVDPGCIRVFNHVWGSCADCFQQGAFGGAAQRRTARDAFLKLDERLEAAA